MFCNPMSGQFRPMITGNCKKLPKCMYMSAKEGEGKEDGGKKLAVKCHFTDHTWIFG